VLVAQVAQAVVVAVELVQTHRRTLGPLQHRVDVVAVPAGERGQLGPSVVDRRKPRGVGVDRVEVRGQFGSDIACQITDLSQTCAEQREVLVVHSRRLDLPAGCLDQLPDVDTLLGRVILADEVRVGGGGGPPQLLGVLQSL
jgi:hypothetical protein